MSTFARHLYSTPLQHSLFIQGARNLRHAALSRQELQSSVSLLAESRQITRSSARRPFPLAKSSSTSPRYASTSLDSHRKISSCNFRQLWTRAVPKSRIVDQIVIDEESKVETVDPSRFSFYSTSSGEFTYAKTLNELASQEPAFELMLNKKNDEQFSKNPALDSNSYWLDVLKATPEEISQLCANLGVHSLTTEDILNGEVNEKLEIYPKYRFLSYRSFNADEKSRNYLSNVNVYILSFPHATLSLRSDLFLNSSRIPKRLDERFGGQGATSRSANDWILFEIIDAITDGFSLALKPLQVSIEEISESTNGDSRDSKKSLEIIASTRRKLLGLRRHLGSKAEILKSLVKRYSLETDSDISLHFSDVEDHLTTITQDLNHWEETLSQSENHCLIQLNLQTSQAQNESNEAISQLTILSTVILPLNVITGLWGMNVMVPGQGVDSLYWFGGLASFMFVVASSGYLLAIRFMRKHRKSPSKHR